MTAVKRDAITIEWIYRVSMIIIPLRLKRTINRRDPQN